MDFKSLILKNWHFYIILNDVIKLHQQHDHSKSSLGWLIDKCFGFWVVD